MPCSKVSPTGYATRSTSCAHSASRSLGARVSGGGARGRLWLEIIASVLDMPLETTAAEEGSAYGAALLGGVAGGVFVDVHDAVARCVRVGETVEPKRAWVAAYAERRARFTSLYPALKALD